MKKCPKCNESYFDNNLNFCLTDGEQLHYANDAEPTVFVDPKTIPPIIPPGVQPNYVQSANKGVSPFYMYLAISLVSVFIGVGLVILLKPDIIFSGKNDSANTNVQTNQNVAYAANISQNESANMNINPAPPPPRPPVSSSKTLGLKRYDGTIGGQRASFDLVWNNDNSVVGNYFLDNNANLVFTVDGTNYAQGRVNLNIYEGSQRIGQMMLYKTLEGSILCWQGDFVDTSKKYVRFCRKR